MQRTLYTSDPTRRSHLFHYTSFVSLCIGHRRYFIFWLRYDFFLHFCHIMNQILIHVLFALFIPDCVQYIGVDLIRLHMLYCFFFFFLIDVDKTRPTFQQSYSTSETNVGDTVVTGERHTAECCQINKSTAWFIQQHVNELNWTVVDQTDHLSTRCRIVSSWREGLQLSFCWSDICIFVMCEFDTWLYRCFFGFFWFFLHSGYFLLKYRLRLAAVL